MIHIFKLIYGPTVITGGKPSIPIIDQVQKILDENSNYEVAELIELKSNWGRSSEEWKLTVNVIEENQYEKASLLMHQSFCYELVRIAKIHHGKLPKDVPEMVEILIAIKILEKLYPKLKQR